MIEPIETEVEVTLGRSSGRTHDWIMRITDHRSGVMVAQIRMNNETFADMMSSHLVGNLAQAEIVQVPWVGKYAATWTYAVDVTNLGRGKELDKEMQREADHLLANEPALNRYGDWIYAGYSGGGGGSRFRTLRFVRYTDEPPGDI